MPGLTFGSWVLNEIWIIDLSSALVGMLMSSSKLFLFSTKTHLNSGVRLLLELCYVLVVKHVIFFTICAKLTMAFTFSSLPCIFTLLYPDMVVVSDLNKNIGGSKNRRASADLHTPIHPHPVFLAMPQAILMPLTCSPNSCVHQ